MIHISELSWNRVSHPRDVVKVGDVVSVKVLETIAASGNGGDEKRKNGGNALGGFAPKPAAENPRDMPEVAMLGDDDY